MDLFTTHLNYQLPLWFCHPVVVASDALSQSWTGLSLYASPLIPLLKKMLIKIRNDQADDVIVIAPSWPRRSWYHLLLQMACKVPFLLPHRRNFLSQCLPNKGTLYHIQPADPQILTSWKLSSVPSRIKDFQKRLSKLSSLLLETQLEQCIRADRNILLAGMAKGG